MSWQQEEHLRSSTGFLQNSENQVYYRQDCPYETHYVMHAIAYCFLAVIKIIKCYICVANLEMKTWKLGVGDLFFD